MDATNATHHSAAAATAVTIQGKDEHFLWGADVRCRECHDVCAARPHPAVSVVYRCTNTDCWLSA